MEKELIKLYKKRMFGEKLSDALDFVRENWRPLLKYITYLLLPVSVVQTFFMDSFMSGYTSALAGMQHMALSEMLPWLSSMGLLVVVQYVGIMLLVALTYTMMQLYEQRPRLNGIVWADLKAGVMTKTLRMLVLLFCGFAVALACLAFIMLLTSISPVLMLPGALILMLASPLLALVTPVYLFEKVSVIGAFSKSLRLGWRTWAGIVGVIFVLYLLVSIVQGVVSMPWYMMLVAKNILTTQGGSAGFVSSFGYTALQFVLGVVSSFVTNCLMVLPIVGLAYQYGHACDKVDGVSVDRDIENFETL